MIAIGFRFTAGGFHATPWGHHVNEGVPEWPPSPWRILRALIAVRFRTLPSEQEDPRITPLLTSILGKLAQPPEFVLPPATLTHTRHFMPWQKKGPDDLAMIFDTFVAVDRRESVVVAWPEAELTEAEANLLDELLENLPYLGRAESWCRASIWTKPINVNCRRLGQQTSDGDLEPVRVLVPSGGDSAKLLEALSVDTGQLRLVERQRDPALSQWLLYGRQKSALSVLSDPTFNVVVEGTPCTVARYAVDARPRPLLTNAIGIADLLRRSCLARYGRQNDGRASSILSGKAADSIPLQGHGHAHYLPTDEDGDGQIDHLTIFARLGFGKLERAALASLQTLVAGGNRPPLQLLLLGLGGIEEFKKVPIFQKSDSWRTVTPFVAHRHPKFSRAGIPKVDADGRQIDGLEDQIRREWDFRRVMSPDLPSIESITVTPPTATGGGDPRWLAFRRTRPKEDMPSPGTPCGAQIRFSAPVEGPVALGHGNHFGLGLFVPDIAPVE